MRGWHPGPSALGVLLFLAGITGWLFWTDPGPAPALRHAYLIPVLWGGLRFGRQGGALASLLALLLYALVVLPAVETTGLTDETLDGLIALGWLAGIGPLVGMLVTHARVGTERYAALRGLQRILARDAPLHCLLSDAAEQVKRSLRATAVTLAVAVEETDPVVVRRHADEASRTVPGELGSDSAAAWAWEQGRSLFIADLESDPRLGGDGLAPGCPRRGLLVPLLAQAGMIGVMVVERTGEMSRGERAAIETLGLHLALGIENARLVHRQRRFAEELKAKVAAATQRLRELDQAKSDFLSIVSHELRTPLTSIQGFSELLLNRVASPARQGKCLGYILHESARLGRIVESLLDLSRIEAGTGNRLSRVSLDLTPLLEVNAELFGWQSPAHDVRVEVSGDLPPVLADRDAVDRVLKNLLSNAIKYSPDGGPVLLRAARSAQDPGLVEVRVEDRGLGIPPEAIGRVFEKYYRLSGPDRARMPGLGIGLALVKSLVEAQGGTVGVTSFPGQGSSFRVTFPAA